MPNIEKAQKLLNNYANTHTIEDFKKALFDEKSDLRKDLAKQGYKKDGFVVDDDENGDDDDDMSDSSDESDDEENEDDEEDEEENIEEDLEDSEI